jgi:Cof subfamily protein (haloacid dehalogenase superfamily)
MTPVRLLAVDLDGTLLNSHRNLSESNRNALREAHACGVRIVFVTGRRYHITQPITSAFDFPHYVITTAGSIARSSNGDRLFVHKIEAALVRGLLDHLKEFRPWTFLISDSDGREDVMCESPSLSNPHILRYVELNKDFLVQRLNLSRAVTATIIEVLLIGHVGEMRQAAAVIDTFAERRRLKVLRTEYPQRDFCLLDIVDGGTDKGLALRELAESLGISRNSVMAIGDNHSDLDMLAYAGCPVVMGNAAQELKSTGWSITATNDEDGVARAIEKFILRKPLQIPTR